MNCPNCGNEESVVKNGHKKQTGSRTEKLKRQRYKCKTCNITFYDENNYYKSKGKSDIRVKLLGIILKHSNFDIADLNSFFGYVENSSEISAWERNIVDRNMIDKFSERIPYSKNNIPMKEYTSRTKEGLVNLIINSRATKGIFVALKEDCSISYIQIFDENKAKSK